MEESLKMMIRSPKSLRRFIWASTRLRIWSSAHVFQSALPRCRVVCRVLFRASAVGQPFAIPAKLDARAVDKQVQRALGLSIEGIHCSTFLTADQLPQTLDKPGRLPERHAGQHFHRKEGLDGGVAEALLAAPPAHRRSFRSPLGIKPDRQ